jgi:hypothetical protein
MSNIKYMIVERGATAITISMSTGISVHSCCLRLGRGSGASRNCDGKLGTARVLPSVLEELNRLG